jgi:hypothetical protein
MRSLKSASLGFFIIACLSSSAVTQTTRVGIGPLWGAKYIDGAAGQESFEKSLTSAKHLAPTVELASIQGESVAQLLLQAHEQNCELAVTLSMASFTGFGPPGTNIVPDLMLFRAKILYNLYRVSDGKSIAHGSGDSYGTVKLQHYDVSEYRSVVVQAMQRAASGLVGPINKSAAKAAAK